MPYIDPVGIAFFFPLTHMFNSFHLFFLDDPMVQVSKYTP